MAYTIHLEEALFWVELAKLNWDIEFIEYEKLDKEVRYDQIGICYLTFNPKIEIKK